MTRGAIALAVIIVFQIGLAYSTTLFPSLRPLLRSSPQVVVFRGQLMKKRMNRDAVTVEDVRVGMRRNNILSLDEIEVMLLEASGGFTVVTRKQMQSASLADGEVPESLKGLRNFQVLWDEALGEKRGSPSTTSGTAVEGASHRPLNIEHQRRFDKEDLEAARHARDVSSS
ncbi:hypothetical protein BCR37DRAFT_384633 [Protomyces lactucae-debilis]|uniref:YetF C-terminal domain-containing protein n=1 Tax=Protomyces lactucae-debilis TaxID=2754530 RepID=A0A1Y2EQT5_PROLT|nr:uncharacterized protein BCR37DRAFT_384633 [Protomyces lactucae-debilis]ORY73918.1 hypothetical protein BCR37DRAFT_384633 [Protomyces lactucae-debilis]